MSIFSSIGSYEDVWKAIIMPARQEYSLYDLGPTEFNVKDNRIKRSDFRLSNKRGQTIECSFFQQANIDTPTPCVIYLHGNGCSRIEATQYLDVILSNPISLFCFDFSGCGKSEGMYTSVGWHEQDDLECVIQYLCNTGKVSKIAVWGRSMGAITTLLYANKDPRISCFILDSPFSSFKQLVKDLAKQKASLPEFLGAGVFSVIRKTVLSKANFDIDALKPIKVVEKIKTPALFGAAKDDTFVSPKHTKDLYLAYGGLKQLMVFEGDHNSQRPFNWLLLARDFLKVHLLGEKGGHTTTKSFKMYFNPNEKSASEPLNEVNSNQLENPRPKLLKTSSPVQPLPPQSHMTFSWLDHSLCSPGMESKDSTNGELSEKSNKGSILENKVHHQKMEAKVSSEKPEKRLHHNLFPKSKKENMPTKPLQLVHSKSSYSGSSHIDYGFSSQNRVLTDSLDPLESTGRSKSYWKNETSAFNVEHDDDVTKDIVDSEAPTQRNPSNHPSISIFGPKQSEIMNEEIIDNLLRYGAPVKSDSSLKPIPTSRVNSASHIPMSAEAPKNKIFSLKPTKENDAEKVLQSPKVPTLPSGLQPLHSKEPKNLSSISNMGFPSQRRLESERGHKKRIFDSKVQAQQNNPLTTRSPTNKSFTIEGSNKKVSKENLSPRQKKKGVLLQMKLNSHIPIINMNQKGSHINLNYITHNLNTVNQLDTRRSSEMTTTKPFNVLPLEAYLKKAPGLVSSNSDSQSYSDTKIPIKKLGEDLGLKDKVTSDTTPIKASQRENNALQEIVK